MGFVEAPRDGKVGLADPTVVIPKALAAFLAMANGLGTRPRQVADIRHRLDCPGPIDQRPAAYRADHRFGQLAEFLRQLRVGHRIGRAADSVIDAAGVNPPVLQRDRHLCGVRRDRAVALHLHLVLERSDRGVLHRRIL